MTVAFNYETAFSRTLGWITQAEQQRLRLSRVAIAGMGGVGGAHAVTLARLGIGRFRLADFDRFELANFNRQHGASMSTVSREKVEVIAAAVKDINPEAEVDIWRAGVGVSNTDAFLRDADLFIDGIDFFVLDVRRALFAEAQKQNIPALTAVPLGSGVAWLVFHPQGMSFDDYFGFSATSDADDYFRFLVGLSPAALHMRSLVDRSRIDLSGQRGPSTPMACMMCAGVAVTEGMKLLLGRQGVRAAPWHHQFDAHAGRFKSGRSWFGGRNPVRRLKINIVRRILATPLPPGPPAQLESASLAERVLDLARWAPSGDNEQPWHFEIRQGNSFRTILRAADPENPYEYAAGRPTWLAAGALLEALSLAANRFGATATFRAIETEDGSLAYDVTLDPTSQPTADPLGRFLETRSVCRTAFRFNRLSVREKDELAAAMPDGIALELFESPRQRFRMAMLNSDSTVLRMSIPQTYPVHARVFHFDTDQPDVGLPISSVPLDPVTRRLFRWTQHSAFRSDLMNRVLAGARMASLQADLWPGLASAGFFVLRATKPAPDDRKMDEREAWVTAGRTMMRFWLTAERLGLVIQPTFAPLAFAAHVKHGSLALGSLHRKGGALARKFEAMCGDPDAIVFIGRIGRPRTVLRTVRSLRRPLAELAKRPSETQHHPGRAAAVSLVGA